MKEKNEEGRRGPNENRKETTMDKKRDKNIQPKLHRCPAQAHRHKIPPRVRLLIKRQNVASPMLEVEWALVCLGSVYVASES